MLALPRGVTMAPRPQPPTLNDEALQGAAFAIESDRPAEAERIAREVLGRNAGHVRAMQLLGAALLMQSRGQEALEPLERAVRQGRDPAVETHLAIALRQVGRNDDAIARLRRAIKREPAFPPAFLELAIQLTELQRPDEALEILEKGVEIAPRYPELWIDLGFNLMARKRHKDAIDAFARALAQVPGHADALFGSAQAMQGDGQYAQAADTYRQLLIAYPDHAPARVALGACLLELGLTESALDSMRAASRLGPDMYQQALIATVSSGRGRFWLKPSDAAKTLGGETG